MKLNDMLPGQLARVLAVGESGSLARRLHDLGFYENAPVECVGVSPFGDPSAYLICGAVIALRASDASDIEVVITEADASEHGNIRQIPAASALKPLAIPAYCRRSLPSCDNNLPDCYSATSRVRIFEGFQPPPAEGIYQCYEAETAESTEKPPLEACSDASASVMLTVALVGNPNVGKSSVFNALTGLRQHTGNWPGKTVSTAEGVCRSRSGELRLVDLPGTYSLSARSPEEEVTRDFILSGSADVTVAVLDATCLCRGLGLVLQLFELTDRVVVCVNLMDEAERRGLKLDLPLLSRRLGVPVVGVTARRRRSLDSLIDAVLNAKPRTAVEIDQPSESYLSRAEEICDGVVIGESGYSPRDRRIDRILTGRVTAFPVMLLFLALVLWLTIAGANYPSQWLAVGFNYIEAFLSRLLLSLGAPEWLYGILILGAFRMLSAVVSVMLPPMAIFFPLFTLLEESGYLPRIAYDLDRPFCRCGACGKQALTTCMGFGCNAAGVVGCRIIDSPRERLLAILTNSFIPCNGRFPTLIALSTILFAGMVGSWGSVASSVFLLFLMILGVGLSFFATFLLSKTLLRGVASSFTLELPPYRVPQVGRVLVRSVFDRTLTVLGRAAAVAAPAGAVLWLLGNVTVGEVSLLSYISGALDPFAYLMGLDGVILLAFVLGFPANETVLPIAAMIYASQSTLSGGLDTAALGALLSQNGIGPLNLVCILVFTLCHWPCSTTLLSIRRETRSFRMTAVAALLPTAVGILLCMLIAGVARLFL